MTTLADLKKKGNSIAKLQQEIDKMKSGGFNNDDPRFFEPEQDKAGNGFSVIRFLPAPHVDGDDGLPWAKIFHHSFEGPGGWYINNSLTSLGKDDPCGEENSRLWGSGVEANKKWVSDKSKRKIKFISNIQVVEYPKDPAKVGQVFLFRYGVKIFDKIEELMHPKFGEAPVDPFDFWSGANFRLKVCKEGKFNNYDKSSFDQPSPISSDESVIDKLWKASYSLKEFLAPKNFKSYDELKKQLDKAYGAPTGAKNLDAKAASTPFVPKLSPEEIAQSNRDLEGPAKAPAVVIPKSSSQVIADDDDDDAMSMFQKLAEG